MAENPRITELRRRVQADPASIAFAQLAEECRRDGSYEEAVEICRNGLASHPDYLSARITLGRALIELGSLDEAKHELDLVVATAPENLPAIRGLAEIFQRKGNLNESLAYYRRALTLARHDVELVENVDRISQRIELPVAPPKAAPAPPVSVEELFDFDKLLVELGEDPSKAPVPQVLPVPPVPQVPQVLVPEAPIAPDDNFADMERELRAMEEQRARDEEAARARALEELRAREEQERLAREEQERLAREEQERLAREEQERLAREEQERLAREEQERLLIEEEARLAREEEERAAREEQERVARDEQERLAREEQERLARETQERLAREEQERRAREEEELLARLAREEEELRVREEEELARQREEFEAQRRRDEEQRRRDEAEQARLAEEARQAAEQRRQLEVLAELEHWLEAIVSDRDHRAAL